MKPILLKIKGINSFIEEQEIDFNKLTENGLFGIFGPTGSGKTSILDGITLALYGQISRYGTKNKMQFINSECEEGFVYFKFMIGNITYIGERSFKKNKDAIKAVIARLYIEDTMEILADKPQEMDSKIKNIISLSYDDFTKTVILPQGKFHEFLLLQNAERTNMLQRIFKLDKYGDALNKRVKGRLNENENNLKISKAKIENFGDISVELVKQHKIDLKEKQEILALNKENLISIKENLDKNQKKLASFKEYELWNEKKKNLLLKEDEMLIKKNQLEKSKYANILVEDVKNIVSNNKNIILLKEKNNNKNEEIKKISLDEEKAKLEWESAELFFNANYNKLITEKSEITQAVSIKSLLDVLNMDRENLLKVYNEINKKQILVTENNKVENNILLELNEKMEVIINKKNKNSIDFEYRNNINKGCLLKTEIKKDEDIYVENNNYIINKQKEININDENITALKLSIDILNEEVKRLLELIENNTVVEIDKEILELEKEIFLKESHLKDGEEKEKRIKIINKEIEVCENIIKENKEIKCKYLKENQELTIKIDKDKHNKYAKELRDNLEKGKPCLVCGSVNHAEIVFDEIIPDEVYKEQEILVEKISKVEILIVQQEEKLKNYLLSIDEIKNSIPDFNLEKLIKNINDLKEKLVNLIQIKNKKELFIIENKKIYSVKNDELNQKNIEFVTIKEGNKKDEEHIKTIKIDNEKLRENIAENQKKLVELTKMCNVQDFSKEKLLIDEKDKNISTIEKEEKILSKSIIESNKKIKEYEEKINNYNEDMNKIKGEGKGKKSEIERNTNEIKRILTNLELDITEFENIESLNKYIEFVNKKIEEVENNKKTTTENLKKIQEVKLKIYSDKTEIEKELEILNNNTSILINKVNENFSDDLFVKYGLTSYDDIINNSMDLANFDKISELVGEYNSLLQECNINLKRILENTENTPIENISEVEKEIDKIVEEEKNIKNIVEENTKNIAVLENTIIKVEKDLLLLEVLNNEKIQLEKKYDILKDLSSLLQGNKFVDYLARKQLAYITIEASQKIGEMSNGRYALELDNTDFIIRDDFNGGIRRSPKTLSGGETFIVSLSLALALSSKMQLKNNAPLEFFFLDEGFGTLDTDLLDTVISSLEKLMKYNMKIGIISHVNDLKSRLQKKLIIKPAISGLHGSIIKIED